MSNLLGNILVSLGFDGAGFFSGMDKAQVVAKNTGKEIEGAFRGMGSAVEAALGPLSAFGGVAGQALDKIGHAANSALQSVTKFAGGGGLGLMAGAAAGATAAVLAADAAFVGIAIHATENANKMYEMSQKTGVAVGTLSAFSSVGQIFGVSADSMGKALEKMNKSAFAAANSADDTKSAYGRLGIAVKDADGQLRPTSDLLLDVADKFSKMPDGIAKTAYAMQIFGKAGAEMIPFLNEGKDGIKEYTDAATKMGAVLTNEAAASAHQFQKDLSLLKLGVEGVENKIMTALVPTLNVLADQFVSAMEDSGSGVNKLIEGVGYVTKAVITLGATVWAVLQQVGTILGDEMAIWLEVGQTIAKVTDRLLHFDFSGAEQAAKDGMKAVVAEVKYGVDESKKIWEGYGETVSKVWNPPATKVEPPKPKTSTDAGDSEALAKARIETARKVADAWAQTHAKLAELDDATQMAELSQLEELAKQTHTYNQDMLQDKLDLLEKETNDKKAAVDEQYKSDVDAVKAELALHQGSDEVDKAARVKLNGELETLHAHHVGAIATIEREGVTKRQAAENDFTKYVQGQYRERERMAKELQDATDSRDNSKLQDLFKVQEAQIKQAHDLGLMSEKQYAEQLKAVYKQEEEALESLLNVEIKKAQADAAAKGAAGDLAGQNASLVKAVELQKQLNAATAEFQAKILGVDTASIKANASWMNFAHAMKVSTQDLGTQIRVNLQQSIDGMIKGFSQGVAKMIVEGKNLGKAMKQLGQQMLESMISMLVEWATKWVMTHTVLAALNRAFDAAELATAKAKQVGMVSMAAGQAAAWQFADVMEAVPFPANIGVAPGAAAAAFGETMGFAAAEKGGIIDGSLGEAVPIVGHGKEMVLPADLSQGLQSMIRSNRFPTGGLNPSTMSSLSATSNAGGQQLHVHVDARGAAPGVSKEIHAAIREMGHLAVARSVAAVQDRVGRR